MPEGYIKSSVGLETAETNYVRSLFNNYDHYVSTTVGNWHW